MIKLDISGENELDILKKSIIKDKENIENMKLIQAFKHSNNIIFLKIVIFDINKQIFLLRTSFTIELLKKLHPCYNKCINNVSYNDEWCVDLSTMLATKVFWMNLRTIINSIE